MMNTPIVFKLLLPMLGDQLAKLDWNHRNVFTNFLAVVVAFR